MTTHVKVAAAGWLTLLLLLFQSAPLLAAELPDFKQVIKDNEPAVVNISTTQKIAGSQRFSFPGMPEFPENSPFNEFFKRFFEEGPLPPAERQIQSLGSGFVISSDGYILTNAHVVKDADKIVVRLNDRREKPAKVVGVDEHTDVALLKIDANHLPTVKLGSSSALEVGDWVLAIGSPFGLEHTATQGIVSALGRSLPNDAYVPFIQTDVAVNPGNSGGPLFNLNGEVVGINAQIFSRSGGYMGLSFAIPINVAMQVADQLKAQGYVTHGWLGVVVQGFDQELAQSFGLQRPRGALISQVMPDSPAAKAGLQVGDIITKFNGKPVEQWSQLPPLVGETPVGKQVPVTVLRENHRKTLTVTIEQLDEQEQMASIGGGAEREAGRLNLTVTDLSREEREAMEVNQGVLVQDVGNGPAAEAGIQSGDVILSLNHHDVKNTRQFTGLVNDLPKGKAVPVLVKRHDAALFLALKLSATG